MSEKKRTRKSRTRGRRSLGVRIVLACVYVLFVIGLSALLATLGWDWAGDLLALNKDYTSVIITLNEDVFTEQQVKGDNGETVTVTRADIGAITDQLYEDGLIEYKFLFKLYSMFSSADAKIVPGQYELNTEMDYRALVSNMGTSSSTRQTVDVTIPEGYTLDQIFKLLEKEGVSTQAKLENMAANWDYAFDWLQDLPLGDYHRLEGYLFPDTYTFYKGEDPKYVINKMLVNFNSKMADYFELFEPDENGQTKSPYTLHEIVILASLIEKETDGQDYKTIASVLRNRLENPTAETVGLLQVDAALVYINGGRAPTNEDKLIDSPYNTYLYKGLTPGPISNPGMASLYAAMNPENTGYFYYALNPETGLHEFSKTYDEHQRRLSAFGNG